MKINIENKIVCQNNVYEKLTNADIILVDNFVDVELKKINNSDWVIFLFFNKNFRKRAERKLVIEYHWISLLHIRNDRDKIDLKRIIEIFNRHENETNTFLKKAYFSEIKYTEHLFFSVLDDPSLPDVYSFEATLANKIKCNHIAPL